MHRQMRLQHLRAVADMVEVLEGLVVHSSTHDRLLHRLLRVGGAHTHSAVIHTVPTWAHELRQLHNPRLELTWIKTRGRLLNDHRRQLRSQTTITLRSSPRSRARPEQDSKFLRKPIPTSRLRLKPRRGTVCTPTGVFAASYTCFIFALAGNLVGAVAMPRTLKTIFARLNIKDRFVVRPICFKCHRIFEADVGPHTFCPDCDEEIFGAPDRDEVDNEDDNIDSIFEEQDPKSSVWGKRKPYMVAPIQLLSTGSRSFFKRPGMDSAVNAWKKGKPGDGELNCMQDAEVWKTIKGPDGRPFFYSPSSEKEIRLGVSFSLDWFRPSKSSFGPSHSSGVMSFCIQNLLTALR
ncbi:hypothetical protein B0H17DRAFT_5806 [Mycena rosella]|uniref:Uncharacterized protein n=1 Tax=Mycena rosella TaxID=1033263 RepID=A0AAD7H3D5_MYCRO|nr:hypothetical protein B0H17DRAFT_5806 [Mycena rosella]